MENNETNQPPKVVRYAIQNILGSFWEMVQEDFRACVTQEPNACHTGHLFVSFVDVAGWLKNKELYPLDFVVVDNGEVEGINLMEERL